MSRYGKWEVIKELGSGGQGTVYLACQNGVAVDDEKLAQEVMKAIGALNDLHHAPTPPEVVIKAAGIPRSEKIQRYAKTLADSLGKYINPAQPSRLRALKVLHGLGPSSDADKARARMTSEVQALRKVLHPNLLRILDADLDADQKWFVGEYHERGPLSKYADLFRGDLLAALKAFRPMVEAVAKLHEAGLVHRDIKPANIFLASDGRLVLGDMGLVYFDDQDKTRVTETYENVGSRDWMPAWAMGIRLEDVKPSFDVFALGKVLWAMVTGKHILQLWYHRRPQFDVEAQFPTDERMRWLNRLLDGCIVQEQENCWSSAVPLLENLDKVLDLLRRGGEVLKGNPERWCGVCGVGKYLMAVNERQGSSGLNKYGLSPTGDPKWRVFECSECGHLQFFRLNESRPAWE